jgi:hypothetical protein
MLQPVAPEDATASDGVPGVVAEELWDKAADCRLLAASLTDEPARRLLLQLAKDAELMAARISAEERSRAAERGAFAPR